MRSLTFLALSIFASSAIAQEPIEITDDEGNTFELTTYTAEVPSARQMAETESGVLFVGSRGANGNLYAVVPSGNDRPEVVTFDSELPMPTGLALHDGSLYVAAHYQILRYPNIEDTFRNNPEPEVIADDLPKARHHGWKYLSVGPDGFLYFNVGAPCNVCLSDDERFASILRMDPESGESEVYAHGIRNTVGIEWHPDTKLMWFTDNGRDWWGDDRPPEEVNVVTKAGQHFGYPFLHGDNMPDPDFGKQRSEELEYAKPVVNIQAHSAALGLKFYTSDSFPEIYKNALFIAEHGSWNRRSKVGYRVSVVRFDTGKPVYYPFADVWLKGERASARPSDVLVANDGSLLIADDFQGAIYRVVHKQDTTN